MAIFSNQATLTYNGTTTNSNIAYGEILDVLAVTKTAVEGTYRPGQPVTYAVTLRNTGTAPLTGLTLTDTLGGFAYGTPATQVYPLTYEEGSAVYIVNGTPQTAPAITAGPPMTAAGLTVPAGGNLVLIYQARANAFAPPAADGAVENTVTVTGGGLSAPVTATETVTAVAEALLTVSKSITPAQVVDNDRITYTFVIQNSGNEAVAATDNAAIRDVFDPILTALDVTFNGAPWTQGVQYNYAEATGLFDTVPGQILVPAATYTRDAATGAYTVTPGIATLVVTGTV